MLQAARTSAKRAACAALRCHGQWPKWAGHVSYVAVRPRLCKVHYLRKADLGTPHSMWISLGQDLNGRFSLADKQRLLAQRIHTFHPTCLWYNACFARYLCPLRPDLWIQPVIHEGGVCPIPARSDNEPVCVPSFFCVYGTSHARAHAKQQGDVRGYLGG